MSALSILKPNCLKLRRDSDLVDGFSHIFSTLLLILFALVVSAHQWIGKPINCWLPAEFTKSQEEYVEKDCWLSNTNLQPKGGKSELLVSMKTYIQWVPLILLVQALLFRLPGFIWRLFNSLSGIQLSNIMKAACDVEMVKDPLSREMGVRHVAKYIDGSRFITGYFLFCFYLICKILYFINIVGQLFFINKFLGTTYTFYGPDLLRDLMKGHVWQRSTNLPYKEFCEFEMKKLGRNHLYTLQCIHPINVLSEKIFVFFWFWLLVLSVFSIISFFFWVIKIALRSYFVDSYLKMRKIVEAGDKNNFIENYLRPDGVFIIQLIGQNVGELVAAEVCEALWCMYKSRGSISTNQGMLTESHPVILSATDDPSRGKIHLPGSDVKYNL